MGRESLWQVNIEHPREHVARKAITPSRSPAAAPRTPAPPSAIRILQSALARRPRLPAVGEQP